MFTTSFRPIVSRISQTYHLRQVIGLSSPIRPIPSSPASSPLSKPSSPRHFSQFGCLSFPRKDSQDKDSMNVEANEYSKSGTDDQVARLDEAAFDPSKTDPDTQRETADKNSGDQTNPLEVSPANPSVSQQRHPTEGGAENSSASSGTTSDRKRSSGSGSPKKGSQVA